MRRKWYQEPLLLLFLLVLCAVVSEAFAGGDCNGNQNCSPTEIDAGSAVENVIGGDDALGIGLSYGMGDVDINEGQNCMGSEQKANVIFGKQRLALNAWCAALFYELNGKHLRAAAMRCSIPDILKSHPYNGDEAACLEGEDLTPAKPSGEGSQGVADAIVNHHDEDLQVVQMQIAQVTERLDSYDEIISSPPQIIQQAAPAPAYSEEDFAAVLIALKGGDDENE
jgi:hypothetical protein